jgi:simple sugar transport system permease protein
MKHKQIPLNTPNSDLPRLIGVTLVIFTTMSLIRPSIFFRSANFVSMGYQLPELGLYSLAMMMVMVTGGINLSIVGIGNLAGISAALIMRFALIKELTGGALTGIIFLGIFTAILVGFLCGIINGFIVARIRIPPMLTTMATSSVFTGIAIVITKGEAISRVPPEYLYFGSNVFLGLPIPLWLLIIALLFSSFLLNKTKFGFEVKFVGSNYLASRYTGINTTMVLMKTYVYSGILCALCGLEILARTDTAKADYAFTYTFQAILASMLGATNPNGGSAKIFCMVLSLVSLQFLSSGFNMLRLGGYFREFTWGLLVIVVMAMDYLIQRYRLKKSIKNVLKADMKKS